MPSPTQRRVWLPWLLLLVPTLLIGATALGLLRNEQQRLVAAGREARVSAERAARDRAQVAADNIELLVAEVRDGLIRELAETPEADLEPLVANWPATNPLVSETFLWRPQNRTLAWPPADTSEHADFRRRHADWFAALTAEFPVSASANAPTVALETKPPAVPAVKLRDEIPAPATPDATASGEVRPQGATPANAPTATSEKKVAAASPEFAVDESPPQAQQNVAVFNTRQARQQVYQDNRASAEEAKARGNYVDPRRAQNKVAVSPAPTSSSARVALAELASEAERAEKAKRLAEESTARPEAETALAKLESGQAAKSSTAHAGIARTSATADAAPAFVPADDAGPVGPAEAKLDAAPAAMKGTVAPAVDAGGFDRRPPPAAQSAAKSQAFADATASGPSTRWVAREVGGKVFFLGWWQEKPGAVVRGVELDLPAVLERAQALLPPRDDTARFALLGPGDVTQEAPSVEIPLATTLPGWRLAAWFAPAYATSDANGTAFFVVAALLVLAFAAAILAGGAIFFRQAAAAEREAALKTNFVSNVSHEMKTPLTTIRMYAEMLADERVGDPEKRRRYFATIGRETTRLTRLVNNALDFGRLEAGRKEYRTEDIALAPWLARLVETHRPRLAELGMNLSLGAAAEEAAVRGDADALEQMTLNLLDNAAKYAAAGGEIELRVEPARDAGAAPAQGGARGWALVVADRGPGVPAAHRERIFERFHRVDDALTAKTSGAGLGLTIARRLARDQGGDLVYRGRDGGGAEFVLTLPAAAATETKDGGLAT